MSLGLRAMLFYRWGSGSNVGGAGIAVTVTARAERMED